MANGRRFSKIHVKYTCSNPCVPSVLRHTPATVTDHAGKCGRGTCTHGVSSLTGTASPSQMLIWAQRLRMKAALKLVERCSYRRRLTNPQHSASRKNHQKGRCQLRCVCVYVNFPCGFSDAGLHAKSRTESRQPGSGRDSQEGRRRLHPGNGFSREGGREGEHLRRSRSLSAVTTVSLSPHPHTHFCSFFRKWESKIPAARTMSMTSSAQPRRRAS